MAHYRALEIVDRLLRDIMYCDIAFGGKVVVLGGDFRQVLPVVPQASRAEIVDACIKRSKLWPLFVILRLTQNRRAGIDAQSFSQWLLKVGDGDLPTDQQGLISLPESCIFQGGDLVNSALAGPSPDEKGGGGAVTSSLKNPGSAGPVRAPNPGIQDEQRLYSMLGATAHGICPSCQRRPFILQLSLPAMPLNSAPILMTKADAFYFTQCGEKKEKYMIGHREAAGSAGNEAWVYGYDVETKAQSSQWKLPHEPRPKKARQIRSNVKVLLTVFFDCRGVVHHEFLPQSRRANKEYYLQVMRNLCEAIRQKRPDLWRNKNWLLHHDNAPAHTSLLVRDILAKNNTLMMPQPPYSPDLAPCDFLLFPKLKRPMKVRRYATLDEIKTASKEELKMIFKNDFLKCFEDWKNRWHKCIISHGDYFEEHKIGIHE
ncbi:hypothetical protein LAZ67_1007037 [Cordylochernes scorpioides]|uniref:ATP-dependent DNA helicase n=1 Tax=Cordylochernes scorpioides TaxID=51811 RepID=A0ABY6JZC6_9ARAC|nr:hypothetical protein LAZ67_1007037 [Cordylochernes scorpioides]